MEKNTDKKLEIDIDDLAKKTADERVEKLEDDLKHAEIEYNAIFDRMNRLRVEAAKLEKNK